jgi:alkylation response protein AidB-like acyl-CoA dehydrogenase
LNLSYTKAELEFGAEVRDWLSRHVPPGGLGSGDTRTGFTAHVEWEKQLFDARWSAVSWPVELGGRGASLWEWLIFEEEYYRAGAPARVTQNGIFLLAPSLFEFGTEEQKRTLLPRMAAADDLWCQGWSEPGAGSDLAAITSKAEQTAEGWRLNGQKTWTTRGAFCTHMFGLFRSDPNQSKHRGLSYFLVPLATPGVEVRGFARLDGDEGFADVFLADVVVAQDAVLGATGGGWQVAMATTGSERGLTLRSPGRFMATFERLRELASRRPERVDDWTRDLLVRCWMEVESYRLATLGTVTSILHGQPLGAASSLNKLAWSELDILMHDAAAQLNGVESVLDDEWSRGLMFSLAGPIYAGTNEIQRNIVAERLLGLPRG